MSLEILIRLLLTKYLMASIGSLLTVSTIFFPSYILDAFFLIFKILSGFMPITEYLPLRSPSFNDSKRKLFSWSSDIFIKLLRRFMVSDLSFKKIN